MEDQYVLDTNMRKAIINKEHSLPLQKYLQEKNGWTSHIMEKIDWTSFQEVMEKRPIHESTNIIKYMHGWQHVGHQKFLFNDKTKESRCILSMQSRGTTTSLYGLPMHQVDRKA